MPAKVSPVFKQPIIPSRIFARIGAAEKNLCFGQRFLVYEKKIHNRYIRGSWAGLFGVDDARHGFEFGTTNGECESCFRPSGDGLERL
jgi:hypothetical protein